jgi:hypothetical protein
MPGQQLRLSGVEQITDLALGKATHFGCDLIKQMA